MREDRSKGISVIVPVYNAEMYIGECLSSVISQLEENDELIVINDGSEDESGQRCEEIARSSSKVRYVKVENAGVSAARNLGLGLARNPWICFVDSDDMLYENGLEIARSLLSENIDALYLNYVKTNEHPSFSCNYSDVDASVILNATLDYVGSSSAMKKYMFVQPMLYSACWGKIYRKSVLQDNDICFPCKLRLSEDLCFNLTFLHSARKVRLVDREFYLYRFNPASVTHNFNALHIDNCIRLVGYLSDSHLAGKDAINVYLSRYILHLNEKIWSCDENGLSHYKDFINSDLVKGILLDIKPEQLSNGFIQRVAYLITLKLLISGHTESAVKFGMVYSKSKELIKG